MDGPVWTLVVELHFYIVLPLIAWGLARASRGRAGLAAAMLAIIALPSLGVWLWAVVLSEPKRILWQHSLPGNFFFIAAGMLLAFARLGIENARPAWLNGRLGNSDLWLLGSLAIWLFLFTNYHLLPLVTVASFLTIGACVLPLRPGVLLRLLDWKPLAVIGVASYSLYVWHLPLQDFITGYDGRTPEGVFRAFVLTIPVCLVVALVSYRLIEEPFLRLRRRWSEAAASR